jgi:hypothetical protein
MQTGRGRGGGCVASIKSQKLRGRGRVHSAYVSFCLVCLRRLVAAGRVSGRAIQWLAAFVSEQCMASAYSEAWTSSVPRKHARTPQLQHAGKLCELP